MEAIHTQIVARTKTAFRIIVSALPKIIMPVIMGAGPVCRGIARGTIVMFSFSPFFLVFGAGLAPEQHLYGNYGK